MSPTFALLLGACFCVSVALMGLAAGLVADASERRSAVGRCTLGVAVLLLACGLWWPLHALRADALGLNLRQPNWPGLAEWLGVLTMAGLAVTAGVLCNRRRWVAAAGVALLLPIASYEQVVFGASEALRVIHVFGWASAGGWTIGLSAALLVAPLRFDGVARGHFRGAHWVRAARWLACTAAAALVCLEAAHAVASPGTGAPRWPSGCC